MSAALLHKSSSVIDNLKWFELLDGTTEDGEPIEQSVRCNRCKKMGDVRIRERHVGQSITYHSKTGTPTHP